MTTQQCIGLALLMASLTAIFLPMIRRDWKAFLFAISLASLATAGIVGGLYLLFGGLS